LLGTAFSSLRLAVARRPRDASANEPVEKPSGKRFSAPG
jgi:hypothetical protein